MSSSLHTLSNCLGGHLILHQGIKRYLKNLLGKNKKDKFNWGQLFFHYGAKQNFVQLLLKSFPLPIMF